MAKKELIPQVDEHGELVIQPTIVQKSAELINQYYRIVQFRGRALIQIDEPYPHFVPLNKERFDRMAYPLLGGVSRSRVSDVMAYVMNAAEDLTQYDDLILFGRYDIPDGEEKPPNHPESVVTVWDMQDVTITSMPPDRCVWRSPYAKLPLGKADPISQALGRTDRPDRIPFIMSLAGNDPDVYDDIMQSMAPIVMSRKPDGVVWWIGDGANGKSTLMDALYKLFPGQFSSLTVKRLVDGRDTPSLNGTLANVVKESSEGRIDDTEIYKSLGTHEDFQVHKFHSQESVTIRGNLHHIFSGNQVPVFNDKGFSARRRTFIIPFNQRFESDPMFEERTFTPEFFGQLASELCTYAIRLKRQGYRYKFSAKTLAAKAEYDTEANNAEQYTQQILEDGVVAFDSFNSVRMDYETWCMDNGYVALGVGHMRRAILSVGFDRMTVRADNGGTTKRYLLRNFEAKELQPLGMGRPGLYTVSGFTPLPEESETRIPQFSGRVVIDKVEEKGSNW